LQALVALISPLARRTLRPLRPQDRDAGGELRRGHGLIGDQGSGDRSLEDVAGADRIVGDLRGLTALFRTARGVTALFATFGAVTARFFRSWVPILWVWVA
jgi:hypothetical protein